LFMRKDHYVLGGTTMFLKDGSPSGNHGILVKHHPYMPHQCNTVA
jgi:hypothetical protein